MKPLMLCAAALLVGFGLSACESRTSSTTVVQPKEVVKEKQTVVVPGPGPAGPPGPAGAPGKPGGDTIVINPPKKD